MRNWILVNPMSMSMSMSVSMSMSAPVALTVLENALVQMMGVEVGVWSTIVRRCAVKPSAVGLEMSAKGAAASLPVCATLTAMEDALVQTMGVEVGVWPTVVRRCAVKPSAVGLKRSAKRVTAAHQLRIAAESRPIRPSSCVRKAATPAPACSRTGRGVSPTAPPPTCTVSGGMAGSPDVTWSCTTH